MGVVQLWDITEKWNTLHPDEWSSEVSEVIHDFQARIIEETERNGYDGHDIPKHKWNFSGALLYSITVITTIGETNQNYLLDPKVVPFKLQNM